MSIGLALTPNMTSFWDRNPGRIVDEELLPMPQVSSLIEHLLPVHPGFVQDIFSPDGSPLEHRDAPVEDASPLASGAAQARPATRILVVEDEMIVALDLQQALEKMGYSVIGIACSGKEAIRQAALTRPDLILMDIHLNDEMDGIEATKQIKALYGPNVIYVTAQSDEKTLQRARETAPSDLLIKPFAESTLQAAISAALDTHAD